MSEIDVATLNVVEDTTSSADEDLDAPFEFASLIFNWNSTVNGKRLVLIGVMLNLRKHVLNLQTL